MFSQPDLYEFVRIGEVAETTTQMLALNLHHKTTLGGVKQNGRPEVGQVEMLVLQQAKGYVSTVKEGLTLSMRTNQVGTHAELKYLLERILVDWSALESELGLTDDSGTANHETDSQFRGDPADGGESQRPLLPKHELIAFGMAAIALGYLPKLPSEQITFPYSYSQPPTYSDIPSPKSAGETLWRIEEMEQTIWQIMSGELQQLVNHRYGQLRRTYGFFETSAHLANQHAERFGVKKQKRLVNFF